MLINNKNNIDNLSNSPPQDDNIVFMTPFNGEYNFSATIGSSNNLNSKNEGCFEGDVDPPAGTYHYYRVLLAR